MVSIVFYKLYNYKTDKKRATYNCSSLLSIQILGYHLYHRFYDICFIFHTLLHGFLNIV